MGVLGEIAAWLTAAENWSGSGSIPTRLFEHLYMSVFAVTVAAVLALPVALYIGHTRRFRFLAVTVANLGRAVPSFAILALALPLTISLGLGLGFWPTIVALVALALPPILTNGYVGIQNVDADTVEAARGMGMSGWEVLTKLEVPLAMPLIIAGLRVATVQVIATATLAALVAWGGLGRFVVDGFAVRAFDRIGGGAVLVALLAVAADAGFSFLERRSARRAGGAPRRFRGDAMVDARSPVT